MGKKIVIIIGLTMALLNIEACKKKDKCGVIDMNAISGIWKLERKFWDLDSNGFDDGDISYVQNPNDSFIWNLATNNVLEYYIKNKLNYRGYWFLTCPSNSQIHNQLYLYSDPDLRNYVYTIQTIDKSNLIIYCKLFVVEFGQPKVKWIGWKLLR